MSLLTGARKSNVLAMRWEDIQFTRAVWRIPETKNYETHNIPLMPQALELLKTRQLETSSPWVFPGEGKSGHLEDPKKGWQRLLTQAKIEDLRLHDLRRSLGSWQAATGASLIMIGKTLAHKDMKSTTVYARLNLDPVRDSMQKATDAIWQAARLEETNN